jgi:O-antigen ligase
VVAPPSSAWVLVLTAAAFVGVAVAAALLTTRRPALGIAALLATLPFSPGQAVGPTVLTLPKAVLVGMLAGLLVRRVDLSALRRGPARTIALAGALVLAATAISGLHAVHRGPVLRESLKSLEYLLAFGAVLVAARADWDEPLVRLALAATVTLVAVMALREAGGGGASVVLLDGRTVPRIAGPLEGPNQLGGYLGLALPVILAAAVLRGPLGIELAALGLGGMALILTLSRASLICTLVALALVAVLARGRSAAPLATAAGGVLLGVVALAVQGFAAVSHLWSAAEAGNPGAVGRRSQLWAAALRLWHANPLTGVGAGNFELTLGRAGLPGIRTHANSLYLQALAESGVIGLVATLVLVAASILAFARGPFREPFVLGALAASLAFALHQSVDLLVFYPKVGELWWMLLGLGAARCNVAVAA